MEVDEFVSTLGSIHKIVPEVLSASEAEDLFHRILQADTGVRRELDAHGKVAERFEIRSPPVRTSPPAPRTGEAASPTAPRLTASTAGHAAPAGNLTYEMFRAGLMLVGQVCVRKLAEDHRRKEARVFQRLRCFRGSAAKWLTGGCKSKLSGDPTTFSHMGSGGKSTAKKTGGREPSLPDVGTARSRVRVAGPQSGVAIGERERQAALRRSQAFEGAKEACRAERNRVRANSQP